MAGTEFECDLRVEAEGTLFCRLWVDPSAMDMVEPRPKGWVFESKAGQKVIQFLGTRTLAGGDWLQQPPGGWGARKVSV